jgi:hypothetical protein
MTDYNHTTPVAVHNPTPMDSANENTFPLFNNNSVAGLIKARKDWENGAHKKSNDELYDILAGCLGLYLKIVAMPKFAKGFRDHAKLAGFTFKSSSAVESRIAKLVFLTPDTQSANNSRISAYARVIKAAADDGWTPETLKQYIYEKGGIEYIRRASKPSNLVVTAKQAREMAENRLFADNAPKLVDQINLPPDLKPRNGLHYAVALVKSNADGTGTIVFGTSSATVVNTVLELAGRHIIKKTNEVSTQQQLEHTRELIEQSAEHYRQAVTPFAETAVA